jgi:CheY-like chemotaxis protein
VLVVEDTPDVARLVHLTLHQTMRVHIAADGAQGLAMAQKLRPDVIVTDLMMPVMDGLEMTRRIREDESLRLIPVVMLTARGDLEDRLAARWPLTYEGDPTTVMGLPMARLTPILESMLQRSHRAARLPA